LENFTGGDLLEWFLLHFNPNILKYTEIIMSEVSVTNNVCSMDKLFFATFGSGQRPDECHVHAMSRLMIEVDEDGKLVQWLDHFDQGWECAIYRFSSMAMVNFSWLRSVPINTK
jgi:hypothetical protein